jgi:hypothetical protein
MEPSIEHFAHSKGYTRRKPKASCFRPALLDKRLSGRQWKYTTSGGWGKGGCFIYHSARS